MKMRILITMIVAFFLLTGYVHALTTYTWDFTSGGNVTGVFNDGSVDPELGGTTAFTNDFGTILVDVAGELYTEELIQADQGLGVSSGIGDPDALDNFEIMGFDLNGFGSSLINWTINFAFDAPSTVAFVDAFDFLDPFDPTLDPNLAIYFGTDLISVPLDPLLSLIAPFDYFLIADGSFDGDSQIWVSSITADAVPAPVPEPSTMLLLGAGLAGLVVYRRKTRA